MKTSEELQRIYYTILELSAKYPVKHLCELAKVSRSGYYKWLNRQHEETPKHQEDRKLTELILQCHQEIKGIYGYYRVKAWLQRKHGLCSIINAFTVL